MYEAVRARPAGPSTAARMAATAADYGYSGIVVVNPHDEPTAFDGVAIRDAYDIDVVHGIEVAPSDRSRASGLVGHHRPQTTILCLRGGTGPIDEYAAHQDRVDVLGGPIDLDHVRVRAAKEHGVRLSVDLGPLLRARTGPRTAALARLRKLGELIEAYDAPYVVTGGAVSHLELRAPRELAAIAAPAGFDRPAIEAGLAAWGRLADRNRDRLSDGYIEPGVHREGDGG